MSNQELTAELHAIVLADYGIDLSNEELFDMARTLTSFYGELIYGEEVKEDEIQNKIRPQATER